MELDRAKYMLKSYLRMRIFKIEKELIYIIENDKASLLSEGEMQFAWQLYENKKKLFNEVFFQGIPSKLNVFEQNNELDKRIGKISNNCQHQFSLQ